MEGMEDPDDPLDTVAHRSDVLWALDGAARSKPKLEDILEVSRSTIDRAIRELESQGFVTRTGGKFTATTPGRLAIREYQSATDRLETIGEASRLLEHVPFEAAPDPSVLEGADIRWPEPPEPARILEPLVDLLHQAETLRAFSRAVADPKVHSDIEREAVEGGLDIEFVYSEAMIDHLQSVHADHLATIQGQENFQMFMVETLPFSLGITHGSEMGPQLILISYNNEGELRGVLYNDTPAAVAWGEDTFRRYRERAIQL